MTSGSRPHLSVVVAAYNEQERLGPTLESIREYLDRESLLAEILVVDDGSSDNTFELAKQKTRSTQDRVVRNPENRGKGYSIRRGVLEARGRWVLMTDADLSTPMEDHAVLAEAARNRDLDVAIGSRGLADSNVEIHQKFPREQMGKVFNLLVRSMTGLQFRDTQCGFKLMDRERVLPLFEKMAVDRFAFDVELLFLCKRFNLKVAEVPVTWRNSPNSRVSMVGDPLNMLLDVARVRWRFRRGAYNP